MHIPDGVLSLPVWLSLDAVALPAVGLVARRAGRNMEEKGIPLLGVMGAFVFAAQMINFPVGVGTSGHLVGAALLAITLGPAAAALVMTAILMTQALIFQDGGVLALGANIMNMAMAGVAAGFLPYRYWGGGSWRRASIFLAGVFSVLASASLALLQLTFSGVPMRAGIVGISAALFLVNALLEGAITLAVAEGIESINPAWLRKPTAQSGKLAGVLAAVTILLAAVGVLVASASPDGLERLLAQTGIAGHAKNLIQTPLADYQVRYFEAEWLRKSAAGLAGLAVIYAVCFALSRVLRRHRSA
jgi:cobalt/nickel transport system permease protein